MGDVRVHNLDDIVVTEFKERAKRNGRSLESELREFLTNEAFRPRRELAIELESFRDAVRAESGTLPDSTDYLRESREQRG